MTMNVKNIVLVDKCCPYKLFGHKCKSEISCPHFSKGSEKSMVVVWIGVNVGLYDYEDKL